MRLIAPLLFILSLSVPAFAVDLHSIEYLCVTVYPDKESVARCITETTARLWSPESERQAQVSRRALDQQWALDHQYDTLIEASRIQAAGLILQGFALRGGPLTPFPYQPLYAPSIQTQPAPRQPIHCGTMGVWTNCY